MYKATAYLLDGYTKTRKGKTEEAAKEELERMLCQTRQQADYIKVERVDDNGTDRSKMSMRYFRE